MARVQHHRAQRGGRGAAFLLRGNGRPHVVQHEPVRIGQRARPQLAGRAVEDHAHDDVGPGALEPHGVDEAVADLHCARLTGQAAHADAGLRPAAFHAIRHGAGRLEHDAGERRIGAEAELFEGQLLAVDRRPGQERRGDGHGPHGRHPRRGAEAEDGVLTSFGSTWSTKPWGTSQTPLRTRTGASRTSGLSSTRTRAQFRVSVTV